MFDLCRTTAAYLEKWLRMMLIWDSQKRGGGVQKKHHSQRAPCFQLLDDILKTKVWSVTVEYRGVTLLVMFGETGTPNII